MTEPEHRQYWRLALMIVGLLTAIRVAVLILSPLELYPDEAQYWWWAQTPDFGYFSKPPLIAWIVWITTTIFGEREWAIRVAAPLLHGATALMLFAIGKRVGDARLGFWSALAYATLPGVSYSSGLISTDVPLLFCWSLALYAFLRALDEEGWRWPLLCGIALGYGLLAKYAMLYFVVGALVAALVSPKARTLVFRLRGLSILLLGLLILAPNIAWNAAHGFPTVGHTATNADWHHARYSLGSALGFFASQFGVFGPVLMAAFLAALWALARGGDSRESHLILAAFAVPPILIITVQGFISEANANWAATSYVPATPLAVAVLIGMRRHWAMWLSFGIDGLAMAILWVVLVSPPAGNALGLGNAFKREEGWSELGRDVVAVSRSRPFEAIAVANRSTIAELTYYARPRALPLRMWGRDSKPHDHFQMTMPLTRQTRRVLLLLDPEEERVVLPTFESADSLGRISVPIGGHHARVTALFDARFYRGPRGSR
jgi:4-amino-4-deoxy-L-arabinose transferase-like glycosyltransferase